MAVFVLDNQGKALMPCTEKRARLLLARGRARVHRLVPMVIRLTDRLVVGTGDMVRAEVPSGVKAGIHTRRVAIRSSGSFNIQSNQDGKAIVVQGISHKHCRVMQRADGYGYFFNRANNAKREQARPKARNAARSALYLPGMNAEVSRAN